MRWLARLFSIRGLFWGIDENDLDDNPIREFQRWYGWARRLLLPLPNAAALASVTPEGSPNARFVLLKGVDERGFVFYTNYNSPKAKELDANPRAVLVFHWPELFWQIRVSGWVERVSAEESDAYFATRPRGSQISAWASPQSQIVPDRRTLVARQNELKMQFRGREVPRPPNWGGYRLHPETIEFWQGRPNRLHDRVVYKAESGGWKKYRLAP